MTTVTERIEKGNAITIVSGEGEIGTLEAYKGKRTIRAIKMRLTKERCHGDRWAWAMVFSHHSTSGVSVSADIESGEYC